MAQTHDEHENEYDLRARQAASPPMTDTAELIARLWAVVILDEDRSDNPLGREAADALSSLVRERDELRHDNEMLTKGGIIEVAIRNLSVADYMRHWEARATAAEANAARMREALTEISSPTQTTGLLWWQVRARNALGGKDE